MQTNRLNRRSMLRTAAVAAGAASGVFGWRPARAAERLKFNAAIDAAWEAGLAALKPSAVELERGLKLHAESLVFDCYGFSPRCAVDGDQIAKTIAAGAADVELQDLQEDMAMTRCVVSPQERAEFELGWQAAGVTSMDAPPTATIGSACGRANPASRSATANAAKPASAPLSAPSAIRGQGVRTR